LQIDVDASKLQHEQFRHNLDGIDSFNEDINCWTCNDQTGKNLGNILRDRSFDIVPIDAELGDPSYLEIQTDKTCNGGCIMCGPWLSTYWQSELKQFSKKPIIDPIDRILSLIDIQKTRRILFLGGEPFLSETDMKVLPLIDRPELVDLQYTTNGSIYPSSRHVELWSKFKSVLINFSLDGIGNRFNYIRYPLKWDLVEQNMLSMMKEFPANVKFKSNHTVNILNLYYHQEFDNWYQQFDLSDRHTGYSFFPCHGVLSPRDVPTKLYNMLQDKYDSDSKVMQTISSADCNDQSALLNYLGDLDQRRGLDWRQVFPEISDCF
jgi:organic radical activating enzyme